MNPIEKVTGPCLILAGAGTGKTYAIVEKIKHLIKNKIYPAKRIVCITFSNEAANNLLLRVQKSLEENEFPIVRTFHGFSADLLRKYGDKIGISKDFKILEPEQAMVVFNRNFKVNPLNCRRYTSTIGTAKDLGIKLEDFQGFLTNSLLKYDGVDLEKRLENLNFELQTLHLKKEFWKKKELISELKKIKKILDIKKFALAWNAYEKLKQKGNYQDYSDLNKNALVLLEKFPEIANDFDYFVVDEFQDTNKVQLELLINLVPHKNISVVGDMNQSIYRFRGAYKENLNLFKNAFSVSEGDFFELSKSRRSSDKVLRTSHKLILNNYQNKAECFLVESFDNREGEDIRVFELKNAREEARKVVEIIQDEIKKVPLEEICVIFRTHQYGRIIKKALEQAGIKYCAVSKASLMKQKSVKTAHDYLVILNKLKKKERGGEQAWWDLIYRLDFQQSDLIKIGKVIKDFSRKAYEKKTENERLNGKEILSVYLFNNLDKLELSSAGKSAAKILIEKIKLMLGFLDKPISELLQEVYRISGLTDAQRTYENKEEILNLNKFYETAKAHETLYDSDLANFLYYLEVLQALEIEIDAAKLEENGVRLMTSHATKGLEYKTVIITNMAQGRFPIERYTSPNLIPTALLPEVKDEIKGLNEEEKEEFVMNYEKRNQMLEERRLAYVSFTRTKERLILTFAGEYSSKKALPSIFLNEIAYKENPDIIFEADFEEKSAEQQTEIKDSLEFSKVLGSNNFNELLEQMVSESEKAKEKKKEHKRFSPSALLLFNSCQKEFEYKYIYNMPERKTISWEAMRLGSFVHAVLEKGVCSRFKRAEDFLQIAREMSAEEEWGGVEISEAETLIRVFFERNKYKYNEKSRTEEFLPLTLAGLNFIGFADRIDFSDNGVEIIDYKTGKAYIPPRERDLQLGFYALAAQEKYGRVRKVILDMLRQDKPLEFEIDESGNAVCASSKFIEGFNIYEVEQELIDTAKAIQEAYKKGFKPCPIEKNCDFCNEYVYGP
ncbi:MAG: ATP-dependent DNA helicase [Nanoarchaeota archaeon]